MSYLKLKLAMMDTRPVDLTTRLHGSSSALKSMGLKTQGPSLGTTLQDLGKTRTGITPEKAPTAGSTSMGPFTTSGTLTNPKVAAADDAPHYAEAVSPASSCATCRHFSNRDEQMGECSKYDFFARTDYTCDGWIAPQASDFLRTKSRGR